MLGCVVSLTLISTDSISKSPSFLLSIEEQVQCACIHYRGGVEDTWQSIKKDSPIVRKVNGTGRSEGDAYRLVFGVKKLFKVLYCNRKGNHIKNGQQERHTGQTQRSMAGVY